MKTICILTFFLVLNFTGKSQSYFDQIVKEHFAYFRSLDSTANNSRDIPIFLDSLIVLNENNQISKRYWHVDSNKHIINIYFEVSKNRLFVIQELDLLTREYYLYQKKGTKKVKLATWIDDGSGKIEKRKKMLYKPNPKKIQYFKDPLVF